LAARKEGAQKWEGEAACRKDFWASPVWLCGDCVRVECAQFAEQQHTKSALKQ